MLHHVHHLRIDAACRGNAGAFPEYVDTTPVGDLNRRYCPQWRVAERLIGEFSLKQNADDMKEALLRRETSLQKKQAFGLRELRARKE